MRIEEGKVCKGGIGKEPESKRPAPPKGQAKSILLSDDILQFAQTMQFKMDKNQHKPCPDMNPDGLGRRYQHLTLEYCLRRIREEANELEKAIAHESPDAVQKEAADVGNFAMMIHAIVGSMLIERPGAGGG